MAQFGLFFNIILLFLAHCCNIILNIGNYIMQDNLLHLIPIFILQSKRSEHQKQFVANSWTRAIRYKMNYILVFIFHRKNDSAKEVLFGYHSRIIDLMWYSYIRNSNRNESRLKKLLKHDPIYSWVSRVRANSGWVKSGQVI